MARKSKAGPFSSAAELHQARSPQVPMSTRTVCRILSRNGLHGQLRLSVHSNSGAQKQPSLNKRQLKKAHSLPKVWMLEKWQKVTDTSNIAVHLPEPAWIRDLPRKQLFGGGKVIVWGYIQYAGVQKICRVEGNINSLK